MTSTLPQIPRSIAAQVKDCLARFDALLVDLDAKDDRSLSRAIDDASGRFKIWSSNIGAHRTGRRSLDHRLRDASHLQENVLMLLSGLAESLVDAREISSGARVPWDQLQFSDSESDESEDEEDQTESIQSQELQHKTEMDQILAGINEAITNLLRLSVAIRNPARHDQWLNFSESFDTTPFQQYDIAHVAAKYPEISGILARRLGTALSRRRCYFKYREEHHNKMAAGLTIEEQQDGKSTIASSLPDKQKASAVSVSMLGEDDNQSDTGFTATSFATSVADTAAVRIPPLPPDADYDRHFECPFCYDIIIVSNRPAWKQHVYSDLQPYMCLWDSCTLGRRMFSTRHEWLQHEQEYHCKAWTCCLGCPDPFSDRQSMQAHYLSHHFSQTQDQIENVLQASETRKSDRGPYTCPLCSTTVSTTKAYGKHAGRHLRELSLFTLPAYATDEVLADDDSENESERENAIAEDDSDDSSDFLDPPSEPMPQKRTTVMPDRMRWIYRDNSGNTQGPFSGLEMHDWYKAGYFSPTMLVKKQEDPDYELLAELIRRIGNSREPFLVSQIGIRHELLGAGAVNTKPPGIFPKGYPENESGRVNHDESENESESIAGDEPTNRTEQYSPNQGPRMSPRSQSGRPIAGEWTIEDELAELRLEIGRQDREHSQSAHDHHDMSPDEQYRRRIQMEAKISEEREELIKRKMELKYMKDRHERAEEEERIALEEERLRKDWELRHEREPSSDEYDKHMLQMENQRLKEAEENLEAKYTKARQERDDKEAQFERLNKAMELGEEQDEREARKETREAEDERLRGKGHQGSDEEPRIIIEVERSERDRHERAEEIVEERHPGGKDRQELEAEAKTTLEEGSRNWSERKRMVDEFVQESVQQLLKAEDVPKLQCLSEEQKQKYRPVVDNLWNIMQMQPQGSVEHNQVRQRLQDWSTKLITQERQYRLKLKIQDEQQEQKEEEEYNRFLLKQKEHADKEEQKKQKDEEEYKRFLLKQRQRLEEEKDFSSNNPLRPTGTQPTYVKVSKEHLDVDILVHYNIPYEIDMSDPNYIIILREMGPKEIEVLFEDTRRMRNSSSQTDIDNYNRVGLEDQVQIARGREALSGNNNRRVSIIQDAPPLPTTSFPEQQYSTRPTSSHHYDAPPMFSPESNTSPRPPSARHSLYHDNPFAQPSLYPGQFHDNPFAQAQSSTRSPLESSLDPWDTPPQRIARRLQKELDQNGESFGPNRPPFLNSSPIGTMSRPDYFTQGLNELPHDQLFQQYQKLEMQTNEPRAQLAAQQRAQQAHQVQAAQMHAAAQAQDQNSRAPLHTNTQTLQQSDEELPDHEPNQSHRRVEHAERAEAIAKGKSWRVDFRSSDEKLSQGAREVLEAWPKSNDTTRDVDDLEEDLTSPAGEQKPRKLRASCDACSRAKVGCDKVRPTCHRCSNLGIRCKYSLSRRNQPVESVESVAAEKLEQLHKKVTTPTPPGEPLLKDPQTLPLSDEGDTDRQIVIESGSTGKDRAEQVGRNNSTRVDFPGPKQDDHERISNENAGESLQNTLEAPPQAYISTLRPDDEFIQREADRARRRQNLESGGLKAEEEGANRRLSPMARWSQEARRSREELEETERLQRDGQGRLEGEEKDRAEREEGVRLEREAVEAADATEKAWKVIEESLGRGSSSNKETLTQKNQREMEERQALMRAQREERRRMLFGAGFIEISGRGSTGGSSLLRKEREEKEEDEGEEEEDKEEEAEPEEALRPLRESQERFYREARELIRSSGTSRPPDNQPDDTAGHETEEEDIEYIADRNRQRAQRREEEIKKKKGHDYAESLI